MISVVYIWISVMIIQAIEKYSNSNVLGKDTPKTLFIRFVLSASSVILLRRVQNAMRRRPVSPLSLVSVCAH